MFIFVSEAVFLEDLSILGTLMFARVDFCPLSSESERRLELRGEIGLRPVF